MRVLSYLILAAVFGAVAWKLQLTASAILDAVVIAAMITAPIVFLVTR